MSRSSTQRVGATGEPDERTARSYAYRRLRKLPATLTYHSLAHTRDDVVPAVQRLASTLRISGTDLVLLRTAAYFHDIGFVEQYDQHEAASIRIAANVLERCGYTSSQVATIEAIIMATQLPQTPCTMLEQILVDADLDSLGRNDFLRTSLALRTELASFGTVSTEVEWYGRQLDFLRNHCYFTSAAHILRDAGKLQNIALLETFIRTAGHCVIESPRRGDSVSWWRTVRR